jgi:Tol biopolymer transport system component
MKTVSLKLTTFLVLMIFSFAATFCSGGPSQTIDKIKFRPLNPRPGDTLKLHISLFPGKKKEEIVTIQLITYTDINHNCELENPAEKTKHLINVADNEKGKDEDSLEDEILVPIYYVHPDNAPLKYVAIVAIGDDSQSQAIRIDTLETTVFLPSEDSVLRRLWRKVCNMPDSLAERLRSLKDILRREGESGRYQGEHNLYIYALKQKTLEKIVHSAETFYLSPTWSFDSKKIAFVASHGGKCKVALTGIKDKDVQLVTTGPYDKDPFWLQDNIHILFVRDNCLQIVNTKTKEVKAIAQNIWIDQILAVSQGVENTSQVIYVGPNEYTDTIKEVYLLELDRKFQTLGSPIHLVYSPVWFLISNTSPSGERVVYTKENQLFIESVKEPKNQKILDDEYHYYEPAWSPDGERIVFVSNREK